MFFNKNIVLEIIRSHFGKEIEIEVTLYIMYLDKYEIQDLFGLHIDFAELNTIDEIDVAEFEVEEEKNLIKGILEVRALVDGYEFSFSDSEEDIGADCVGTMIMPLEYYFEFHIDGRQYSDYEMRIL